MTRFFGAVMMLLITPLPCLAAEPDKVLVEFVKYVDELPLEQHAVRMSGVSNLVNKDGSKTLTEHRFLQVFTPEHGEVYDYYGRANLTAGGPPSVYEHLSNRDGAGKVRVFERDSLAWIATPYESVWVHSEDPKKLEEFRAMRAPRPNGLYALHGLYPYALFRSNPPKAETLVRRMLDQKLASSEEKGNLLIAVYESGKPTKAISEITFDEKQGWRPVRFVSSVVSDGKTNKSWECELQWQEHHGVYRQKKSVEKMYFGPFVDECELQYEWLDKADLKQAGFSLAKIPKINESDEQQRKLTMGLPWAAMFEYLQNDVTAFPKLLWISALVVSLICLFIPLFVLFKLGFYWLQAYMCDADVRMRDLITIYFLRIDPAMIVNAKIIAAQAALRIDHHEGGMTTSRIMTHALAGGSVINVVTSMILAHRARIDLNLDQAMAMDLTGRDLLHAIQTSITPKVIQCPNRSDHANSLLSAIAKDGVELLVRAQITVRTNMERLVGGATEETIIARVGQMIISTIGSANSYTDILAQPSIISTGVQTHLLEQDTAYAIVSIDIAQVIVGKNVGARLRIDQANADMRIANAQAEVRRALAVALTYQMFAKVAEKRVELVMAESLIPPAVASAICRTAPSIPDNPNHPYPRAWNEPTDDRKTAS